MTGTFDKISSAIDTVKGYVTLPDEVTNIENTIDTVNDFLKEKTEGAENSTDITGDTGLTLQNYGKRWVRYYGGTAETATGDTNINLTGSATAVGVIGGGSPDLYMGK